MIVNTNIELKNLQGDILKDIDGQGNAINATVKVALVNAILSPVQGEKGVDKVKKYELAKKVYEADEVDLNEDEIKIIKERVGELYAPIIVGQIFELLKV